VKSIQKSSQACLIKQNKYIVGYILFIPGKKTAGNPQATLKHLLKQLLLGRQLKAAGSNAFIKIKHRLIKAEGEQGISDFLPGSQKDWQSESRLPQSLNSDYTSSIKDRRIREWRQRKRRGVISFHQLALVTDLPC